MVVSFGYLSPHNLPSSPTKTGGAGGNNEQAAAGVLLAQRLHALLRRDGLQVRRLQLSWVGMMGGRGERKRGEEEGWEEGRREEGRRGGGGGEKGENITIRIEWENLGKQITKGRKEKGDSSIDLVSGLSLTPAPH